MKNHNIFNNIPTSITKRDGTKKKFEPEKISIAISKAFTNPSPEEIKNITDLVVSSLAQEVSVEDVQDAVEQTLIKLNYAEEAKRYILYRKQREIARESRFNLTKTFKELIFKDSADVDLKRENANIDGNAPMGMMLRIGSETNKDFTKKYILRPEHAYAHDNGDIHIHDLDFYDLTLNCCQISLKELFKKGFSTGHGYIREPNSIRTAAALVCIVIQSNQNDMFGGQAVPMFEYELAPYVVKTFSKELEKILEAKGIYLPQLKESIKSIYNRYGEVLNRDEDLYFLLGSDKEIKHAIRLAKKYTENETYQAMEALIHNLNSMQSRAGAQVPFSSINYGTGTRAEERLIIESILEATNAGLGNGETSIFPVQIFKVKDGINTKEGDPNYDLFQLSCKVSAKRLFPNYIFLDSPYNLQYYKDTPETEVSAMGCRTRVIDNINGDSVVTGRGNIAFVTINLPRLGIKYRGHIDAFYEELTKLMEMCYDQLMDRYNFLAKKHVYNFSFLMKQGVWYKSSELDLEDTIEPVLKHGTLSIGFIGLAECLKALIGEHHGESEYAQKIGLEIISYMRKLTDEMADRSYLNFSLFATPAEGLSGRFTKIDKKLYGIIPGVTDREYYTNSSHIPVYYPITAARKIELEAPYHELCNAGVICYVECDGNLMKNTKAFENIILYMKRCNIHYGSINHPIDRCPVCGYTGVINDVCPKCGRHNGEGVSVEKLKELGVKL